jgi:hypothetical protein
MGSAGARKTGDSKRLEAAVRAPISAGEIDGGVFGVSSSSGTAAGSSDLRGVGSTGSATADDSGVSDESKVASRRGIPCGGSAGCGATCASGVDEGGVGGASTAARECRTPYGSPSWAIVAMEAGSSWVSWCEVTSFRSCWSGVSVCGGSSCWTDSLTGVSGAIVAGIPSGNHSSAIRGPRNSRYGRGL